MEVLEYRQKFEVELSTFPDSIHTETPKKLLFNMTCVCACVKKFVSEYLTTELTDLDENFGVCCNWPRIEDLPLPVQSDLYFPSIWRGGRFAILLILVSRKLLTVSKNREDIFHLKVKDLQI